MTVLTITLLKREMSHKLVIDIMMWDSPWYVMQWGSKG